MLANIGFSNRNHKPPGRHESMKYLKGSPVIEPSATRATAVELLKAQNAELSKEKMVELTYGPKRPDARAFVPDYVKMDNKILQFEGVIHDSIRDWWTEKSRVHLVKLFYFMEDNTLKVFEPIVPNSGLCQGTLLQRKRYKAPCNTRYYDWRNLNIGADLTIYGKTIHLYDCDQWTREYLTDMGVEVNKPEPKPEDPIHLQRRAMLGRNETRNTDQSALYPASRFFEYGDKVLKFFGIFKNNQESPIGIRRIILKFYLGDGALEVVENWPPNRGKIGPWPHGRHGLDNVPSNIGRGSWVTIISKQRVLIDREKDIAKLPCYLEPIDDDDVTWITPEYFKTGEDLQILGKTFFLNKCDEFTKQFYLDNFGISLPQVDIVEKPKPCRPLLVPPHEYGKWEESIEDCFKPHSKAKIKGSKMSLKGKEMDNTILRFSAFMDTSRETEQDRVFVLSYFMEDDTVKIHEQRVENSGHPGGLFLARSRLRKDLARTKEMSSAFVQGARPEYYGPEDFRIGAKIKANGATFVIKDADLAAFKFMEDHPEIFPGIDVKGQKELADYLKGYIKPSHSERMKLLDNLQQDVIRNTGSNFLPYPATLDLGSFLQPRDQVENKLYSANLPISGSSLRKLLDVFTFRGKTDVDEVATFLKVAMGHSTCH